MDSYDVMKDISDHVTLVQLMDSVVHLNNAISVVGYWIYDSNYEKQLVLNRLPYVILSHGASYYILSIFRVLEKKVFLPSFPFF